MTIKMKEYGSYLGSRSLGERVRSDVADLVRSSEDPVVLDFLGVDGMTQSFADEVFRKIALEIPRTAIARIHIQNANEDIRSVLRYATSKSEASRAPQSG